MARKPREDDIKVIGYLILEDGGTVPMEEATPEQLQRFQENAAKRASIMLSDYYSQHPEQYEKLPSLE